MKESFSQDFSINSVPLITTYTSEEYNAGMQNWSLAQDVNGMIYIGNNLGLLEFDGNHWRQQAVGNGTKVRSVKIGLDGKIYVGAQGEFGYFQFTPDGQLEYKSVSGLLKGKYPVDETWSVYIIGNAIYYCTFDNIFKYSNNKIEVIDPGEPIGLSFLINNQIYFQIPGQGIAVLRDDLSFDLLPGSEFYSDKSVRSILPISNHHLLIATHSQGLFLFNRNQSLAWGEDVHEVLSQGLINNAIHLINGNIAIGTQNEGLIILDANGNLKHKITEASGLGDRTVNHLYEDPQGNIWASLHDGISLVELGLPFGKIGDNVGISGSGYAASLLKNQVFIGTNNHVYQWRKDDLWHDFSAIEGTQGQSYSLQVVDDELMLSHHNGAFTINDLQDVVQVAAVDGTWMFVRPAKHPDKLIGGHYNGLYLLTKEGNQWQLSHRYEGFSESCRVLVEDNQQNLWMSHGYKGVFKIRFTPDLSEIESVKYYNQENGFPSNNLINVFQINGDLVFAAETGIYRYDREKDFFVPDPVFNRYFDQNDHVREMEQDAMGNVYFITNEEAGVLRRNQLGAYEKNNAVFNKIMPYMNDALEKIKVINNQTVLFSAKNGFIAFDPTFRYSLPDASQVLIRSLQVTTDSIRTISHSMVNQPNLPEYSFKYKNNSIRVNYSSPAYGMPNRTLYRVKLENFDQEWSEWTASTTKEYTNLREGDYTFQVQSRNIYGQESELASFSFNVDPPWFRSKLAFVLYFLAIGSSLVILVVSLEQRHSREKNRMESEQQKALEKRDIKFVEFSKQSTEEITRLRNEKLQSEIEHKNRELGSAAMQIISKNEFIGHLKQSLNGLSKKSNNQALQKDFGRIIQEIERNIASDNDWEQFEIHFDKVHGNFSERLKTDFPDLTPQEMKLAAYLRMNLSTKEIAQLLNISVRGVEIARYRLRKKLKLERRDNLSEFILKY